MQTHIFPLYEYVNGTFKISKPPHPVEVKRYLEIQNRFSHLTDEEIEDVQYAVDKRWSELMELEEMSGKT